MLKTAIWWTTMACNFKCKYCWQEQHQQHGEMMPVAFLEGSRWVDAWNKLSPLVLDITGGEPFLLPGFVDVISRFNHSMRLAITTNLSHDIDEFVDKVDPSRFVVVTCSYHPTEYVSSKRGSLNTELFIGRCLRLQNSGFKVNVNFVTWPDQMYLVPHVIESFGSYGLSVHIDPYAPTKYHNFSYSPKQLEFLSKYVVGARKDAISESLAVEHRDVLCSAGIENLSVWQDGSAWRCLRDMDLRINQLGNIFDDDFSLLTEMLVCHERHNCAGCDRDKVTIVELTNANAAS